MPAKAKNSQELAIIVRDNLERLTADTRYPKATLANICCVTRGTVSHWFSTSNPKLPSLECLMMIADHYQIMVDTLLTSSGDKYLNCRFQTYSDAFISLLDFINESIIEPKDINNLILRKLCVMYSEAHFNPAIPERILGEWVKDIVARFCIQMPTEEALGKAMFDIDLSELTDFLYENGIGIRTMDELETLENLAHALSTPELVKKHYKEMQSLK